jgi:hypothetical protein
MGKLLGRHLVSRRNDVHQGKSGQMPFARADRPNADHSDKTIITRTALECLQSRPAVTTKDNFSYYSKVAAGLGATQ